MWPILKVGLGALAVLLLSIVGYRFGSGINLRPAAGGATVSVTDVGSLVEGSVIYFTLIFSTEEQLKRLALWPEVKKRVRFSQPFLLDIGTHVGSIHDVMMHAKVSLTKGGTTYPWAGKALELSAHHDSYLIFFPRYDMNGKPLFEDREGTFDIVVDLGDMDRAKPKHVLTFRYPLPAFKAAEGAAGATPAPGWVDVLMLMGAAMAALLLTCTPCLLGSLALGSLTIGTTGGEGQGKALEEMRRTIVKRTVTYLGSLMAAYLLVAVAVSVFKLKTEYLRPVEFTGGVVLLVIGLALFRNWPPVARLEYTVLRLLARLGFRFGRLAEEGESGPVFALRSSSAMGASLAMVCSVAGAPALSTILVVPVLVYAGLSSISWALLLLLIYLLVCALPFFFIAVGLGELLLTASVRFRNTLEAINAFLLVALGVVLIVSPEVAAGALTVPARFVTVHTIRLLFAGGSP